MKYVITQIKISTNTESSNREKNLWNNLIFLHRQNGSNEKKIKRNNGMCQQDISDGTSGEKSAQSGWSKAEII